MPKTFANATTAALATLALLGSATVAEPVAHAQDRVDLDEDGRKSRRKVTRKDLESAVVREIERGFYLKANAGTSIYFLNRGSILRPGTTLTLTVGQDVLDKDKISAGWEVSFYQAIHNGLPFEDQGDLFGADPNARNRFIQGDIHTLGFLVGGEVSAYPVRRLGIGGQIGAGVVLVPLLMDKFYYDTEVVGDAQGGGAWGGPQNRPPVHQGPKPAVYAGPTLEYYTKLSHFSLGIDLDAIFVIGLDLGFMGTGFFKYTF